MPVETKNLHVPLSLELHTSLKAQATRLRTPATVLARDAIEAWIQKCKQEQLTEEIRAYAEAVAGSGDEFDKALEAAGIEFMLETE
ncbi:MAG: hypothetical protein KF813_03100 [Trueperaceae bacterium]|nr:hypothetical protein [Trueperaceae bacterium]